MSESQACHQECRAFLFGNGVGWGQAAVRARAERNTKREGAGTELAHMLTP